MRLAFFALELSPAEDGVALDLGLGLPPTRIARARVADVVFSEDEDLVVIVRSDDVDGNESAARPRAAYHVIFAGAKASP